MENTKTIKNIQDIQALRISGLLYALDFHTTYNTFDSKSFSINESELIAILKNNDIPVAIKRRLHYYAQKNEKENVCYHEGVFYNLSQDFLKGNITKEYFLYKITQLLLNEIEYMKSIKVNAITFPSSDRIELSEDSKKLKKDKKIKDSFLLAPKPKNTLFKKKKHFTYIEEGGLIKNKKCKVSRKSLYLKENELYGFNLMNGYTGSGIKIAALSLFIQNMLKGNGGIYFNLSYHHDDFTLYSVAKSLRREDDLLLVNASNFNKMFSFDFKDIIENNKIIVFKSNLNLPSSEDLENFIDQFMQFLFINLQSNFIIEKGFMIMLVEMLYFLTPSKERMIILNEFFKKKKMTGMFVEPEEILVKDDDFKFINTIIKNYFIFRQEANVTNFLGEEIKESAKNFNVGEFMHLKNLNDKNFEKYCFYFHNCDKNESIYETMF